MEIIKFVSPEIIFGQGALGQVGDSARRLGATRVFVVSDRGVADAGWISAACQHLEEEGLEYAIWTGASANPKDTEVEEGVRCYREAAADAILAIGGGSAIDAAKAIAILATNGRSIGKYEGVEKLTHALPPMISVPSTAGSGSEVSQFSIIVDSERRLKMTIVSKSLVPDICITDPLLLATVGKSLMASTGMDALCHAIEAYLSVAATCLTDIHALNAMKLIAENLTAAASTRTNVRAKTAMAVASLQSGLAFSNAILGLAHAIAHQLGGLLDMPHGEACAILLPYVMRFNLPASVDRYGNIARALGERVEGKSRREAASLAIRSVEGLLEDLGIYRRLSEIGFEASYIPRLAENAVKDVCIVTNPRDVTVEDVVRILESAF